MRAVNKYIIINTIEEEITTSSGLLLSNEDANKFRYKKGEIVKPGTEVTSVKEGEIIYYDRSAGFDMIINGKTFTIILERDIVVVL
tara:strand:- start:3463 stop:3720 length:258 start_codon:yes stop_codon:yes gene_type:complete